MNNYQQAAAQEAIDRLEEIFKELQEPNSVTHDAWDWMDAHFQLEVLKSVLVATPTTPDPRMEEIRRQRMLAEDPYVG